MSSEGTSPPKTVMLSVKPGGRSEKRYRQVCLTRNRSSGE